MIPEWASSGPALIVFLFFVVLFRAQGTYWLGRAAAAGALSATNRSGVIGAIGRWFDGPVPKKGAALLDRWGIIIIPLGFLTVGIQSAINAGAGLVRMKWRTYTIAMIPGCVMWAFLYGLGMLAVWRAAILAIAGSLYGRIAIVVLLLAIVAMVLVRRSKKKARQNTEESSTEDVAPEDLGTTDAEGLPTAEALAEPAAEAVAESASESATEELAEPSTLN